MNVLKTALLLISALSLSQLSSAHYPFVAPLAYQTFNNHSAIISGFYDNPFASEIYIKNFKFHYHTPANEKIEIDSNDWSQTQTLSSYSLENKVDGTYRIRGEKRGSNAQFALDDKQWKALLNTKRDTAKPLPNHVIYASDLKKKTTIKTVQTFELIETFVSRRVVSDAVIKHLHDGFDVQFITHPNAIQVNQSIQFKILDEKKGISDLDVDILKQTSDFSRDEKVYKTIKTNTAGELNFELLEKGQYLLKIDYQQPFTLKTKDLKRYKYTLSFNVI